MIPKIIHYCWFGNNPLPEEYKSYIEDWKKLHPDWEIKQWDETNSPLYFPYIENALAGNFFSNISNFIRLYALYEFGGVYLDTDVKLLKSLEELRQYACFLGFEEGSVDNDTFWVNNAICGAESHHPFIKECFDALLDMYDGTEQSNLSGPQLTTKMLIEKRGLKVYGHQLLMDVMLFPKEFFYPIPWYQAKNTQKYTEFISEETLAVHMWSRSWFTRDMLLKMVDDLQIWSADQTKYISDLKNGLEYEQQNVSIYKEKSELLQEEVANLLNSITQLKSNIDNNETELLKIHNENEDAKEGFKESILAIKALQQNIADLISNHLQLFTSQFNSINKVDRELSALVNLFEAQNEKLQNLILLIRSILEFSIQNNQFFGKWESDRIIIKELVRTSNVRIEEAEKKISSAVEISNIGIENINERLTSSNSTLFQKLDEHTFLINNVIHKLNDSYNKQKAENEVLISQIQVKEAEVKSYEEKLNEANSKFVELHNSIGWYQRTFENRSLLGLLKERFVKFKVKK